MASADLINYVRESLANGLTLESIKNALSSAGWGQADIDNAVKSAGVSGNNSSPKAKKPIIKLSLIVLAAILILGGLAYAGYWLYLNKFSTSGSLSADQALAKSFELMRDLKSAEYTAELKINNLKQGEKLSFNQSNPHLAKLGADSLLVFNSKTAFDFSQSVKKVATSSLNIKLNNIFGFNDEYNFAYANDGKRLFSYIDGRKDGSLKEMIEIMSGHWFEFNYRGLMDAAKISQADIEKYKLSKEEQTKLWQSFKDNKVLAFANQSDGQVRGERAYHYKITVNKDGLKKYIAEHEKIWQAKLAQLEDDQKFGRFMEFSSLLSYLPMLSGATITGLMTDEDREDTMGTALNKWLDKFNAWPEMDFWVSKKTYYPLQFTAHNNFATASKSLSGEYNLSVSLDKINQPLAVVEPEKTYDIVSVIVAYFTKDTGVVNALNNGRATARDERRVSNIQQIQTAAELYYNDAGQYPDRITPGLPVAYEGTIYMEKVPSNPEPADGGCQVNNYVYKPKDGGKSYELTYCLGADTDNAPAGINQATPSGVTDRTIVRLDGQRIGDVKKMQISLEQYFVAKKYYPATSAELKTFMESQSDSLPTNPKPVGKSCPDENYIYTPSADKLNYQIKYCLNGDPYYGGFFSFSNPYKAGVNYASTFGSTEEEARANQAEAAFEATSSLLRELFTGSLINYVL